MTEGDLVREVWSCKHRRLLTYLSPLYADTFRFVCRDCGADALMTEEGLLSLDSPTTTTIAEVVRRAMG